MACTARSKALSSRESCGARRSVCSSRQIREKDAVLLSRQELIEMYTLAAQERQEKLVEASGALEEANARDRAAPSTSSVIWKPTKQLDLQWNAPRGCQPTSHQPAAGDDVDWRSRHRGSNNVVAVSSLHVLRGTANTSGSFALGDDPVITARDLDEARSSNSMNEARSDLRRRRCRADEAARIHIKDRKPSWWPLRASTSVEEVLAVIPRLTSK
jgi:hypothetical protein